MKQSYILKFGIYLGPPPQPTPGKAKAHKSRQHLYNHIQFYLPQLVNDHIFWMFFHQSCQKRKRFSCFLMKFDRRGGINIIIKQMLVVKNIKVQFQKRVVPVRIRRVQIGYKQDRLSNKKKYLQLDSHTFQWEEDITLQLYYNVPLNIHCEVDEPDINPESPNAQLSCTLKIIDYKGTSQTTFLLNRDNKKMATLTITYRVNNQHLLVPQQRGVAVISSILAHLNHYQGTQGFIQIALGYKNIFTPTVKVIAGELLWAEQLIMPLEDFKDRSKKKQKIMFVIYLDEQPIGKGSFELQPVLKNHLKYKKFEIVGIENQNQKLGTLFIDIVFRERNGINNMENSHPISMNLHKNSKSIPHLKNTDSLLNMRQPSQHFFHQHAPTIPTPVKSSRSQSKLTAFGSYNSQATAKLLQKYEHKKKKIEINYQLFDGIFNYGQYNKEENIRHLLKERRKKQKGETSLPKLK